jgi:hypothetical protein
MYMTPLRPASLDARHAPQPAQTPKIATACRIHAVLSDPGVRDCVHNIVHTGIGDMTCPIPYLCCTLLACEVGLADTEGSYSSCTRVQFLG